jgi:hypothetical protein
MTTFYLIGIGLGLLLFLIALPTVISRSKK